MKLWQKVLWGMVLGIALGTIVQQFFPEHKGWLDYIKPVGTIFINLIMMVVVPLIYFSLISGITSMRDTHTFTRIGIKAGSIFIATSMFAVVIGIVAALVFQPGDGVMLDLTSHETSKLTPKAATSVMDLFLSIIPKNAIGAMAEGNILQVVVFAIFTGVTLVLLGEKARKVTDLCQEIAHVIFKMIEIIIKLSPYAVFALIAWVVGTQGMDILISLIRLVITVVVACMVQYVLFGIFIAVFGRISPFPFYRKMLEPQSLAFSTSSSKATLPTTMRVLREKMGVSASSTSFVLPLGASINMDGTAIYLGICTLFFAQALGIEFHMHEYLMIVLLSTFASIGAAGFPGGSMVMMPMLLSALNLPIEGMALILGIDRVLDMLRTTINITGDSTITLIVDKSEGTLDEAKYHSASDE